MWMNKMHVLGSAPGHVTSVRCEVCARVSQGTEPIAVVVTRTGASERRRFERVMWTTLPRNGRSQCHMVLI